MSTAEVSRRRAWVMAARPQTLPAAAAPVIVGSGVAWYADAFRPLPALVAFVGAALIQIGTNFANDYYDAVQGADTEDREGFTRVTAGGLIEPAAVKRAMVATFALAILSGTYLVYVGGVPILVIGLVSVACGVAYTGGPYPLGYHGLGDLFVFVFFGVVAVTGTYYVQAAAVAADASNYGPLATGLPPLPALELAAIASLPIAALATNILVVNNIRDREEDARTGKTTLAVAFGYRVARGEFLALLALAYATPITLVLATDVGVGVLAALLSLPLAASITRTVLTRTDGDALNPALERTGQLLAAYAVLFALAADGGLPIDGVALSVDTGTLALDAAPPSLDALAATPIAGVT
jgi:1,4-dihydroxy-2-naphthoate octaprenyltransferase